MAVDAAHGQEPVWPFVGPAFQASAADLQKAAAQIVPEKFMEATVLFERDSYLIDAEGRVTYRHSLTFRIDSQAGVDDWAETSARYAPWYQNQPVIQARVILPDGRVSQLDPKTVIDVPVSLDIRYRHPHLLLVSNDQKGCFRREVRSKFQGRNGLMHSGQSTLGTL